MTSGAVPLPLVISMMPTLATPTASMMAVPTLAMAVTIPVVLASTAAKKVTTRWTVLSLESCDAAIARRKVTPSVLAQIPIAPLRRSASSLASATPAAKKVIVLPIAPTSRPWSARTVEKRVIKCPSARVPASSTAPTLPTSTPRLLGRRS
ncbi:hypothetical protein BKA67DRAFT_560861 [Truncatella angustata]|uniref:Uncharacterized protein n=1 Tax=Truncatella angustata TaxID=152316 RepID=A0A9P8UMP6_9PEZI|nr:uncharacterized protein BKA67DRAFT_560861 [Truncatella angustata]KAH6655499.1 hypothetical protein BKA67DRAFT_560861 [Truncatella angustata]